MAGGFKNKELNILFKKRTLEEIIEFVFLSMNHMKEICEKENLSTAEQLKVEIKENFRLKNQLENNRKEYQETYKDIREELGELKKENEELKISNKEIDKECSRLEKKEVELINENEHYEDLIYALKTYYDITEEDLEECMKNDR